MTETGAGEPEAGTLEISPADLTPRETYLLLRDAVIPRPIAWVSTIDAAGRTNIAPYSFFNVCSPEPPILGFGIGPRRQSRDGRWTPKDTLVNLLANGEMVINIVPEGLAVPMVETSAELPPGESEFAFASLEEVPSRLVRPPRVRGAPVAFECRLHDVVELGLHRWVLAAVVLAHVDERVHLGERDGLRHRIDLTQVESLRPLGRLGRANYSRLRSIETLMRRDGNND